MVKLHESDLRLRQKANVGGIRYWLEGDWWELVTRIGPNRHDKLAKRPQQSVVRFCFTGYAVPARDVHGLSVRKKACKGLSLAFKRVLRAARGLD